MHYSREILRRLREENGHTQSFIAEKLHVGQKTYSDYELGRIRIPVDHLIKLAEYYNVDMNYITGVSGKRRSFPNE